MDRSDDNMDKQLITQYYEAHKGKLLQYLGPDQQWLGKIGKIHILNDTLYLFQSKENKRVLSDHDFFDFVQFLKPVA